ncbi:hypothetical protein LOAG_06416 [Loa loa]|uniref:Uncharacterized protein n=1 Tax=Loa loa TaxID=7209 RepID=A0A1I7VZ09_LOALO|nr:hypothetical protein LOAG_06416 [Loa loa]EFO22066.2 hypothetical protein LOAG_06416 [Loa loa]
MELTSITVSSCQHDRQQQQQTSLTQSNLHQWESMNDNCSEKQQQWITEQPSTSLSNISVSPTTLISNSTIDSNNCEHYGNDNCSQPKNVREIREEREKFVRFVYFGQALLVIIVALVWIAFIILERDPKMIIGNITTTQNGFIPTSDINQ